MNDSTYLADLRIQLGSLRADVAGLHGRIDRLAERCNDMLRRAEADYKALAERMAANASPWIDKQMEEW